MCSSTMAEAFYKASQLVLSGIPGFEAAGGINCSEECCKMNAIFCFRHRLSWEAA
jgi:hypothetical protein